MFANRAAAVCSKVKSSSACQAIRGSFFILRAEEMLSKLYCRGTRSLFRCILEFKRVLCPKNLLEHEHEGQATSNVAEVLNVQMNEKQKKIFFFFPFR